MQLTTINEVLFFATIKASALFEIYLDAEKHSLVTESTAIIDEKVGSKFSAYDGYCFGENIWVESNKLIIQTWRTNDWPLEAKDSILILRFVEEEKGTKIYMTHEGVPIAMANDLRKGWEDFYWSPWRGFFSVE